MWQRLKVWLDNLVASQLNARMLAVLRDELERRKGSCEGLNCAGTHATSARLLEMRRTDLEALKVEHMRELLRYGRCLPPCNRPIRYRVGDLLMCGFCFLEMKERGLAKEWIDLDPSKPFSYVRNAYTKRTVEQLIEENDHGTI